jgi:CubicO group peptidase (beta-lactamase class C family)
MTKHSIPGLSLAITRDDRLVYAQGFGFADTSTGVIVHPDNLFRIASVSKPITAIAVMRLIEQGKLSLSSKVFGSGSLLGTTFGTNPYSTRTLSITVQHLLEHTSGYSNAEGDPMFMNLDMTQSQLITWVLDNRQPTSDPGTKHEYLNFGYCLLGRVIEKVTGQSYERQTRIDVLNAAPQRTMMSIGGDTVGERQPMEVTYYPSDAYKLKVRRFDAHGGWIARPIDLVGVLTRVDGFSMRPDIIKPETLRTMWTPSTANSGYGKGWIVASNWKGHNGAITGTIAYLVRRDDGFGFAVTANTRPAGDEFVGELKSVIDGIIDSVAAWPTYDLF